MSGNIDFLTLIALLVTVFVVIKLRSALGRKTPDEDQARYERQAKAREAREAAAGDKVVTLPRRERDHVENRQFESEPSKTAEERLEMRSANILPAARGDLMKIAEHDPSFDAEHFANGAKQAYEMIVTAFAEGNRDMLSSLLSRDVFEGFSAAIEDREGRGEKVDQSFVGINRCDITEASLDGSEASITLKFVSQLITATMNHAGDVISGDSQKIQEVTDIWTFARDVDSQDPNWRLVATQASH
ncbi:MAG: Tim44/TimA family putative adaptor protein [Alphaproteobacteria bacterium]|nr:Tim44/TimA family putative adaptor protein [Alphaproteobacteria bacterium]